MHSSHKGVLLAKNGEMSIVSLPEKSEEYYKVCNLKKAGGFDKLHVYKVGRKNVEIWGRTKGPEKFISKWELPPPLDTSFAYGSQLAVVTNSNEKKMPVTLEEWKRIYEKMIGRSDFRDAHIAPHTLRVASMFSVLSRLKPSQKCDPLTKMKIYNGEDVIEKGRVKKSIFNI